MSSPTGWERSEAEESEVVEVIDEPTKPDPADTVDAEVVETSQDEPAQPDDIAQPTEPVTTLALGDAAPEAPAATAFDVTDAPTGASAPSAPSAPASQPGGSWLDLPPMPDLPGLPPMAPPPPASQGFGPLPGQAAPQAQQYTQPTFGVGYDHQRAGQAYGHGANAPTATQAPGYQPQYPPVTGQSPYAPYGTPAGAGYGQLQPYTGYDQGTDTQLAAMAHWLPLVVTMFTGAFGFAAPLILMLTRGKTDAFVRANAVESLNFQLTMIVAMLASAVLSIIVIGVAGLIVFPILALIFQILGSIAASRGEVYRYPVRIPFVK